MAESTKSVADVKESISQHIQEVNETVSNTAKDLGLLTKNLVEKKSVTIQAFKNQAAQNLKIVQDSYAEKEEKVFQQFKPETVTRKHSQEVAQEYERILQENVGKLKQIAQEDFRTCDTNNKKLIEETKAKLHRFISQAFDDQNAKEDFTKTAGAIFANVNEKIRNDLHTQSSSLVRTRSNLSPELGNVFVHNVNKPAEEIEAEQLLRELFEEQLLEFNEQIKKDFENTNCQIVKLVDEAKAKLNETLQAAKEISQVKSVEAAEVTSISNLPTASAVGQNINNLLNKAGEDFQSVQECMLSDVAKKKQKINDNAKYYSKKLLGNRFLNLERD